MTDLMTPDVCIIGGGSAGTAAALALASINVPTVLVERRCVGAAAQSATEHAALLAAAARAKAVRTARHLGIASSAPKVDWAAVKAHVESAGRSLSSNTSAARLTALGVQVVQADASFSDRRTLIAGGHIIRPRRFILATGTADMLPQVEGLADVPHLPLGRAIDLEEMPKSLLVLGNGARAVELAQAFAHLGSKVTLVGRDLLEELPFEGREAILSACRRDGVAIAGGLPVSLIQDRAGIKVHLEGGSVVTAARLLVEEIAVPETGDLRLDLAGVRSDERSLLLDRHLRTSNRRIYAIGSVAGHAGEGAYDAGVAIRNIVFRQPARRQETHVPRLVATDPAHASVGFDEGAARQRAGAIRILRWPYRENARAQAEACTAGHIRIVTDTKGRILGVAIVGREAAELIRPWAVAVRRGRTLSEALDDVSVYPAFSDLGRQAAMSFQLAHLTNSRVQRIIGFLRRLG